MASIVAENWEYKNAQDDSENFELSQINHNFLMSLLDETQIDDCDDEKLTKVIRSLEAEIEWNGQYAFDDTWGSDLVDCQSSNDESDGHDRLIPHNDLDLNNWMDIETIPSSPTGDIANWYIDHDHVQLFNEFNGGKNCSNLYYGTPLEEQDYNSMFHDINVTAMNS